MNETSTTIVWKEKRIMAPLAKQESITESISENCFAEDERSLTGSVSSSVSSLLPNDEPLKKGIDMTNLRVEPGAGDLGSSHLSPLNRAKNRFKIFMGAGKKQGKKEGGDESDDSPSEDGPSSPSIKEESCESLSKAAPSNKKGKENRLSVDDVPEGDKKKHRRKNSKIRKKKKNEESSRTSQDLEKDDNAIFVENFNELSGLEHFLSSKMSELSQDIRREAVADKVYKAAVKEFHEFVITAKASQDNTVQYRHRDIMVKFNTILKACAVEHNWTEDSLVSTCQNAFRAYLHEFNKNKKVYMKSDSSKEKKTKKKGNRQTEDKNYVEHNDHQYLLVQFGIPQHCESCNHLMWMVEKVYVCRNCQYTIHRKCCVRSFVRCKKPNGKSGKKVQKIFRIPLEDLTDTHMRVPAVIERLFCAIEVDGLYTVGVYRKPGHAAKIKQLSQAIDTNYEKVDFTDYPINVLTSVTKKFFREMPEPLMLFDLYDDYIRAGECADKKERIQLLYSVIEKLPETNNHLLTRLIFHLAKIAQHEDHNRMSASSLAIVFAPGIMRCNRTLPAQQSLEHVPKLNLCLESIIEEQLNKLKHSLADIKTLDTATASATDRLKTVRASIRNVSAQGEEVTDGLSLFRDKAIQERNENCEAFAEELMLKQQIMSMQQEKELLTIDMPSMDMRHSSSEEDMLSTDDLENTGRDLGSRGCRGNSGDKDNEERSITMDQPDICNLEAEV